MTYKLIAGWLLAVVIMGVLNMIATTEDEPGADDQGISMVNSAFGTERVSLDEMTLGDTDQGGVLGTSINIAKTAATLIGTIATALFLDYEYFEGDLAFVRIMLLALSVPVLVLIAKEGMSLVGGMVRGLFGRGI